VEANAFNLQPPENCQGILRDTCARSASFNTTSEVYPNPNILGIFRVVQVASALFVSLMSILLVPCVHIALYEADIFIQTFSFFLYPLYFFKKNIYVYAYVCY
jgi:hypothetical protein